MLKISNKILSFLKGIIQLLRGIQAEGQGPDDERALTDQILEPSNDLTSSFRVGDVLLFRYQINYILSPDWERMVLVAACKRGFGGGVIKARTGNTLISCFKLEGSSETVVSLLVEQLYNREKVGQRALDALKRIIGSDSYRTYNLSKMKHIQRLKIPKEVYLKKAK